MARKGQRGGPPPLPPLSVRTAPPPPLACGQGINSTDILIGMMIPLSGIGAPYGDLLLAGMQVAFQEANDAGGVLGRNLSIPHGSASGPFPPGDPPPTPSPTREG